MATIYLLDTTILSDLMRDHRRVETRLAALRAAERACICTIVRGEVLFGLERMPKGRKQQALAAKAQTLFARIPCEPVPAAAADHYARIKREVQRKGSSLDENDLWIAATALALPAVLVTRDSDYQRVSGLQVEDWTQ